MNQGMYGDPFMYDQHFHAAHSYTRKFCGCMSLQGGCILACLIWMGINLYVAILSFQERSPVFSYQDKKALMVTGAICIVFLVAVLFAIFALISIKPAILQSAHRTIWIVVFIFIINFFVNIVLFGVNRPNFKDNCVENSRGLLGGNVNSSDVEANQDDSNLYNCEKLWEDELKFAIVLFIMLTIAFLYWALCLWSYSQKQKVYFARDFMYTVGMAPGGPAGVPPPGVAAATGGIPPGPATMMNLKPKRGENNNNNFDQERGSTMDSSPEMATRTNNRWLSSLFSKMTPRRQ
ncbi:hypothetical protein BDA99DRAFT_518930 [Phascolomyces articulosus]|uniref:Uncharacterized protein n=1 Tax=Phascolomyces articulosus TaxID=60185 RepID=A0AAD5K3H3_9FUNG|nr:hypothetical protein BDA99DRAFT_518930 [Phascolomyces articulosus]